MKFVLQATKTLLSCASLVLAPAVVEAQSEPGWPEPDERVVCGPLTLEVYLSRTAHLFHVVDQLAAWNESCHGQYRENMALSAEDEALLGHHAGVRAKRGWGQGLEQTFYTPLALDRAVQLGLETGHVRAAEAAEIVPVLEHFAPRVDELFAAKGAFLEEAVAGIDRERLARVAGELARFTGVKELTLPVFPIASPLHGGGGMDGGRLRWEIADAAPSFAVLAHEVAHGFFQRRVEDLRRIAKSTPGLSLTLLGEGFAHAIAPGLHPDGAADELRSQVARQREQGTSWTSDAVRGRTYALALRPLLREALEGTGTLDQFLPRARDVFLALREVEEASGPPKLALAGPLGDLVRERLRESKYRLWISWFDHRAPAYSRWIPELRAGDLLVLLVALEDPQRIPAEFARLAPMAPEELERELHAGRTVSMSRAAEGSYRVVLLAAPTGEQLAELARTSPLLDE